MVTLDLFRVSPIIHPNRSVTEGDSDSVVIVFSFQIMCSWTQHQGWLEVSLGILMGSRVLWLHFFGIPIVWQQTAVVEPLCWVLAPVYPLAQPQSAPLTSDGVPTEPLCSSSWRKHLVQPASSPLQAKPTISSQLQVCVLGHRSSPPFLPPLFVPTCPPLDGSTHESLRHVFMLRRESFVELWLINVLKFQGERPRGSLTSPVLWGHCSKCFCL